MIPRRLATRLRKRLGQFPAVALLGPRQAGKTTLARCLTDDTESIYLDLENPADLEKLREPLGYLTRIRDKLVVLDEVQRVPGLFRVLRGIIDEGIRQGRGNGQFLLLGSASIDLLQQSGESLAGRIAYLELSPLEILEMAA